MRGLLARVIAARLGDDEETRRDAEKGLVEGALRIGAEAVDDIQVSGSRIQVFRLPDRSGAAAFLSTCHLMMVYAATSGDARLIAEGLAREPDASG